MKRETAKKFVEAANKIDEILGNLDSVSFEIDDEAERKKIRRAMASVFVTLYEQLTREVVKDYPDLHPDTGTQEP
jgi:2-oxo-4-hydroxy-4-carboxy--5-ureidoimidazoline (OHCU) decarboxylase